MFFIDHVEREVPSMFFIDHVERERYQACSLYRPPLLLYTHSNSPVATPPVA